MDISKRVFLIIVSLLIIIRFFMVVFAMMNLPQTIFANGFPTYLSGDESGYFTVAKNLSHFEFKDEPGFGTIGAAIVYVPFIWATGAEKMADIAKLVFIFQAFLVYSVSIVLVACLAFYIFKNYLLGVLSGVIYIFYPYLLYLLNIGPNARNLSFFIDGMWFKTLLSDVPSAFFVYLGAFLFLWSIEKADQLKTSVWLGLVAGFSALIRITNIFFCMVVAVGYLYKKKYKEFFLFSVFAFLIFSGQLFFNLHNYGGFLRFGQLQSDVYQKAVAERLSVMKPGHIDTPSYYTPHNYLYLFSVLRRYIPFYWLILPLLFIVFVLSLYYLYRIGTISSLFTGLMVILYVLYYGAFSPAARTLRYWHPIIPFVIIISIASFLAIKKIIYEKIANNNSGV